MSCDLLRLQPLLIIVCVCFLVFLSGCNFKRQIARQNLQFLCRIFSKLLRIFMNHLVYDCGRGDFKSVRAVLYGFARAEVPPINPRCITAAAGNGSLEIIELLFRYGAPISSRLSECPLMAAVLRGNQHVIQILLENGAKHQPVKKEFTPLISACIRGQDVSVSMFLEYGADVDYQIPSTGDTALMWAAYKQRENFVLCIISLLCIYSIAKQV